MKFFVYPFFVLLLFSQHSYSIQGFVRDISSKLPLDNVKVIINSKEVVYSDSLGNFSFNSNSEKVHVDFEKDFYKSQHKVISKDFSGVILIEMHPLEFHFDDIVITDLSFQEESKINGNYILRGKELDNNLKSSIAGIIKNEAGIGVRSMGPAPARPVFRGMGGASIQINQDGMANIDLSNNSPDHAVAIDPFTSKDVKIFHGSESLIYSPLASSIVIDLGTENIPQGNSHKTNIILKNQFESVNSSYHGMADIVFPLFENNFKVNLSQKTSNDISTPLNKLENTSIDFNNLNLGFSRHFDDLFIGANFNEFSNNYGIPPGGLGQHPKGVDIELFKRTIGFNAKYHFHDGYFNDLNFKINRTYFKQEEFESSGLVGARFLQTNYDFRLDLTGNGISIFDEGIYGISGSIEDFDAGAAVLTPEIKSNSIAGFIFQKHNSSDHFFDLGLRYDLKYINPIADVSTNFTQQKDRLFYFFTFSFTYLRKFNNSLFYGMNLYKGSRAPTGQELYSKGPHLAAYSYEIGNENLDYLNHYGSEINFKYGDKDFIKVSMFYNYYDNYLVPRNTGEIDNIRTQLPIYQIDGVRAHFMGFELSSRVIIDKFFVSADLSYTYAHNLSEDLPVAMIPPLKGHLKAEYKINSFNLFLRSEFANSQKRLDEFELPTGAYIIFDIGSSYCFNLFGGYQRVGMVIENVLNIEYYNHLSRIKDIMPEPGANIRLYLNNYF